MSISHVNIMHAVDCVIIGQPTLVLETKNLIKITKCFMILARDWKIK